MLRTFILYINVYNKLLINWRIKLFSIKFLFEKKLDGHLGEKCPKKALQS